MKKIMFSLAFFAVLGLQAAVTLDPPPDEGVKINIAPSCPATVTANKKNVQHTNTHQEYSETFNGSSKYDARTTVTRQNGNQETYTTRANTTSNSGFGYVKDGEGVSRIDVTCSPTETEGN
mgnify:FL=1